MQNSGAIIRKATEDDIKSLSKLSSSTFYDTYAPTRPKLVKDFLAYIKTNYSEKALEAKLKGSGTIYLLAEVNGSLVGYAHINLGITPEAKRDPKWVQLAEIYVAKDMQGKGLGKHLMEEFFTIAKKQGTELVWLGVWDGNKKAIDYYRKWGFEVIGSQEFKIDVATDIDLIMQKRLE